MPKALNDLIVEAAQKLRALDAERYADVIRWMLAREKRERDAAKLRRKRKQVLFTERGERIELYKETVKRLEEE